MRRTTAAWCLSLAVAVSGCGALERSLPAEVPNTPSGPSGRLTLVDWGINDGMLSVSVRNESGKTLERADAVFTITDAGGNTYVAKGRGDNDLCCTILSLPPDGTFGVYVDLGVEAEDVEDVEVTTETASWVPAPTGQTTELAAGEPTLQPGEDGAEVRTDLTAEEDVAGVAAQAFLTGPDGEFLAVVSGRFSCFTAGEPRNVVMELFHPVPEGTTVADVVAYPVSAAVLEGTSDCAG